MCKGIWKKNLGNLPDLRQKSKPQDKRKCLTFNWTSRKRGREKPKGIIVGKSYRSEKEFWDKLKGYTTSRAGRIKTHTCLHIHTLPHCAVEFYNTKSKDNKIVHRGEKYQLQRNKIKTAVTTDAR